MADEKKPRKRGPSNRLNARQTAQRQALVIRLRAQGLSWNTVVERSGVSIGHAKRLWSGYKGEMKPDLQDLDPLDVVVEQLARIDQDIETLAEIALNRENHPNARVGALNAKRALYGQMIELLQAIGKVPKHLGKLEVELEVRYVAQQLVLLLEEFVPDERLPSAERKLMELLRRGVPAATASSN